jgi:hypothetical protein
MLDCIGYCASIGGLLGNCSLRRLKRLLLVLYLLRPCSRNAKPPYAILHFIC